MKRNIIFLVTFIFSSIIFAKPETVSDFSAISGLSGLREGSILLNWIYPGPEPLPTGSNYYIQYSTFSQTVWSTTTAQVVLTTGPVEINSSQEYVIQYLTGFPKQTTYYFKIWVSSSINNILSDISQTATGWITNFVPSTPYFVECSTGEFEGSVKLRWTGSGDDGINEPLDFRSAWLVTFSSKETNIWFSTNAVSISTLGITADTVVTYFVTGLQPSVTYYFRVWAKDDVDNISDISDGATIWAQTDISAPRPITNIFVFKGFRHVCLNWTIPFEDSYPNGFIFNMSTYTGFYQVKFSSTQIVNDDLWQKATFFSQNGPFNFIPMQSTLTVVTGLTNYATYFFGIRISDEMLQWSSILNSSSPKAICFNSAPVAKLPATFYTFDPIRETASVVLSTTSVKIVWSTNSWHSGISLEDNSSDETYGDFISSYTVRISTFFIGSVLGVATKTISGITTDFCIIAGLLEDTTYFWSITAFDSESLNTTTFTASNFKFVINSVNSPPIFPNSPLKFAATIWHSSNIEFDFKDAYDKDYGDFITRYELFISTTQDFSVILASATGNYASATSYFHITEFSTPSSSILLPFENSKIFWYALAFDSGAPFGYMSLSTQTPIGWFYINQRKEPPEPFNVYYPTGSVKQILSGNTTFYVAYSTPIIFNWDATVDLDPDFLDTENNLKQQIIYEYFVAISTYSSEPYYGNVSEVWRSKIGEPSMFTSTAIVNSPPGYEPGTGTFDLPLVENNTYYYRVGARAGRMLWYPYPGYFIDDDKDSSKIERICPSTSVPAISFIIDFCSEAPYSYNKILPSGVINPVNLSTTIYFSWTDAFDPDPFDYVNWYCLVVSTVNNYLPVDWKNDVNVISSFTKLTQAYINLQLDVGGTYYWQVLSWGVRENSESEPTLNLTSDIYGLLESTGVFFVSNNKPNSFELVHPGTSVVSGLFYGIKSYKPTFYWQTVFDDDNYDPIISSYIVKISSFFDFPSDKTFILWSSTNSLNIYFELQPKTTYFWIVFAYDKFGNYQSCNSTYTFYTTNFEPNNFSIIYPKNDVVVDLDTPIFIFENNGDPDKEDVSYDLQISTYQDFMFYLSSSGFTYSYLSCSTIGIVSPWKFEDNKRYFIRVIASDFSLSITTSNVESFWINSVEETPNNFDVKITSGICQTVAPLFRWDITDDNDPKDYVDHYEIIITTISGYVVGTSTYIIVYGSSTNFYNFSGKLKENASYRWFVKAYDTKGNWRQSISSYVITINAQEGQLDEIYLISPGLNNGIEEVSQPVNFIWTAANKTEWWQPIFYTVYYTSFNSNVIFSTNVFSSAYKRYAESNFVEITTSCLILNLIENSTYAWWVKAEVNGFIVNSTTFYFFVNSENDPPESFTLNYPSTTVMTRTPVFSWQKTFDKDDRVTKYELIYSKKSNFDVIDSTNISIFSSEISNYKLTVDKILDTQTTYYWKVVAYDTFDSSTTSNVLSFFVPVFAPSTFSVLEPSSQQINTNIPEFIWEYATHPEENSIIQKYVLTLSTCSYFTSTKVYFSSTTFYKITEPLLQNITYYFSISAYDNWGIKGDDVKGMFFVPVLRIPSKVDDTTVKFSITNGVFSLSWQRVDLYEDGSLANDILGYNIYRSQNIENIFNSESMYSFCVSSCPYFQDNIGDITFFYLIKVRTITGIESKPSDVISTSFGGSKVVYKPDLGIRVDIPKKVYDGLNSNNYIITVTTQAVTANEILHNVISKFSIKVKKDGSEIVLNTEEPILVEVNVPNNYFSVPNYSPSLFKYNGYEYISINSMYDPLKQKMKTSTNILGDYLIRVVELSREENIVNIYPKKIFTPQSSQDNKIHFVLSNPSYSQAEGIVYDLSLRYVAKMKTENYELVWDGKYDTGEYVPKGIYIYKIKIGSKTFTGTIIVAK